MSKTSKTPRERAEAVSEAYFADVATGRAPGLTLADLIEIAIEDAAAEAVRERDEARAEVELLLAPLMAHAVIHDAVRAVEQYPALVRAAANAQEEVERLTAEVERLRARTAPAEDALRYVDHHLTHGGLYGPWNEFAKQRVRAALTLFSDPTKDQPMTDIYRQAVETFGAEAQLRMVQEECGELVAAVNQHLRGRTVPLELAEEIADVEIMCAQARVIVGRRLVEEAKRRKLARLAGRIAMARNEVTR